MNKKWLNLLVYVCLQRPIAHHPFTPSPQTTSLHSMYTHYKFVCLVLGLTKRENFLYIYLIYINVTSNEHTVVAVLNRIPDLEFQIKMAYTVCGYCKTGAVWKKEIPLLYTILGAIFLYFKNQNISYALNFILYV